MVELMGARKSKLVSDASATKRDLAIFELNEEISLFNPTTLKVTETTVRNTLPSAEVIKKETEAIAMFATKDWKLIQQQRRVERQTDSVQNRGPLFSFKQSEEFEASVKKTFNPCLMFSF